MQSDAGYQVNLRKEKVWKTMGFPDGDAGEFTYSVGGARDCGDAECENEYTD